MLNTIFTLLLIIPGISQLLLLCFIFNSTLARGRSQKLVLYALSLVNGLAPILLGLLGGYLADAYLISASGYTFWILCLTEGIVIVSIFRI